MNSTHPHAWLRCWFIGFVHTTRTTTTTSEIREAGLFPIPFSQSIDVLRFGSGLGLERLSPSLRLTD